jgi:four helix bundle protein
MHKFKQLTVWKKAIQLVVKIYKTTKQFPQEELYGLTSQMRRSAVSIPANIAEGCGRGSDKELCRFLDIANGSSFELETFIIICQELTFIDDDTFGELDSMIQEVQKMIHSFKKAKSTV